MSDICANLPQQFDFNPICTGGGGKFVPLLSYFNIAPKQKKIFALMHPDFESNLITHIFKKVWGQRDNRK